MRVPTLDGRVVLLMYRYVALMFCPFAYGMRWYVIDDSRSNDREITLSEATRLVGRPPVLSFWRRYGLLILIVTCVAIALAAGGAGATSGPSY
jgi:hypothetical protein